MAGLVLAGSADFKTELSQSDMFDPRLQAVVLAVVDVSYGERGASDAPISWLALQRSRTLRWWSCIHVHMHARAFCTHAHTHGCLTNFLPVALSHDMAADQMAVTQQQSIPPARNRRGSSLAACKRPFPGRAEQQNHIRGWHTLLASKPALH